MCMHFDQQHRERNERSELTQSVDTQLYTHCSSVTSVCMCTYVIIGLNDYAKKFYTQPRIWSAAGKPRDSYLRDDMCTTRLRLDETDRANAMPKLQEYTIFKLCEGVKEGYFGNL